jgi:hypothetical protein
MDPSARHPSAARTQPADIRRAIPAVKAAEDPEEAADRTAAVRAAEPTSGARSRPRRAQSGPAARRRAATQTSRLFSGRTFEQVVDMLRARGLLEDFARFADVLAAGVAVAERRNVCGTPLYEVVDTAIRLTDYPDGSGPGLVDVESNPDRKRPHSFGTASQLYRSFFDSDAECDAAVDRHLAELGVERLRLNEDGHRVVALLNALTPRTVVSAAATLERTTTRPDPGAITIDDLVEARESPPITVAEWVLTHAGELKAGEVVYRRPWCTPLSLMEHLRLVRWTGGDADGDADTVVGLIAGRGTRYALTGRGRRVVEALRGKDKQPVVGAGSGG